MVSIYIYIHTYVHMPWSGLEGESHLPRLCHGPEQGEPRALRTLKPMDLSALCYQKRPGFRVWGFSVWGLRFRVCYKKASA